MKINRLCDLWLSARGIYQFRRTFSQSQRWPAARLMEYQVDHCRALLVACYEQVDYYRKLFWECDFDPYRDFRGLEDLQRIPILTKPVARQNHCHLVNPRVSARSFELRTSGSTGHVFKEWVTLKFWEVEQAMVWRHWSWLGYKFRDRMAIVRSYVPAAGAPLWKLDRTRNFYYFSAYHLSLENAARYLSEMRRWRPLVLRGYPSSLYILGKMALELKIQLPPLKGILTASEVLLPHYRQTIEAAFDAKVFDWYGQAESTVTMNECERHHGLHINSEYGICELVSDPSLPSDQRKIVATCLHNYAMPLVRYDTGDTAVVSPTGPCPCGRSLPAVSAIKGRSDAILAGPDGRLIPTVNLYTLLYQFDDVEEFQLVHTPPDELELRLTSSRLSDRTRTLLLQGLRDRLGTSMKFQIVLNEGMIMAGDGKKLPILHRAKEA